MTVVICGGPSGSGLDRPTSLIELADSLGVADSVRFLPPQTGDDLAALYRAADLVAVPSHNESFGLVALEAQACGTPVVAAAVGGLVTAVRDGVSGVLVDGHDPGDWARVLDAAARRAGLPRGAGRGRGRARRRASPGTARPRACCGVYREAVIEHRALIAARLGLAGRTHGDRTRRLIERGLRRAGAARASRPATRRTWSRCPARTSSRPCAT